MSQALEFMRLPEHMCRVVFYSEGKSYWPIFKGLIDGIINNSDLDVCYITSDNDDPGSKYIHSQFKPFIIDAGYIRNWLFENLKTDVMIMTMPDLHQYQVKRSKHKVHYIYVQHALMSLHMVYRHGAFDWFDTIFCSGPHHVNEIRSLEKKYKLPKKIILEHGYSRLDSIINENLIVKKVDNVLNHALFAPSWGINAAIESGLGGEIVGRLLTMGYKVTLRPHPETWKSSSRIIKSIIKKYSSNQMFFYDENVGLLDSFYNSDFMVSDWSGAALEYAFGLSKPVIFLNLPQKINNPNYCDIDDIPFEISSRESLGVITNVEDLTSASIDSLSTKKNDPSKYFFNIGNSDAIGVEYILNLIDYSYKIK